MSKVTDIIADVARIDSIESTADASAPQATTYTKTESDTELALKAPKANPVFTGVVSFAKGADIASASALTLGTDGNYFDVTGTTTITSIGTTGSIGTVVKLHFDGILTLTHNATSLVLPSGANIVTAVGDEAEFIEESVGSFRCTSYVKADGTSIVSEGGGAMQFVAEVVASNASTVIIAPPFDNTYDRYIITSSDATPSANNCNIALRVQINGSTQSANYSYSTLFLSGGSSTYSSSSSTNFSTCYISDAQFDTNSLASITITLDNPSNTSLVKTLNYTTSFYANGSSFYANGSCVNWGSILNITGIVLYAVGGSISGTFRVYGIKKS